MPTTFAIPDAAKRAAGRALLVHRQHPDLDGVRGVSIAQRLQTGTVDADTVQKMHRFFRDTERQYLAALGQLRTEQDSAVARSWALHGAEAGQSFAQRQHKALVTGGTVEPDLLDGLLDVSPEQIYARFQAGAWRWEYGLDPAKAAAFVQRYTEATGQILDLPQAFGESARAVGNQLWRRYHGPSLFQQARKALRVDDWSLQQAARADLARFRDDLAATAPKRTGAADRWPTLVAYLILAVEAPDLLADVDRADVEAVYRMYFAPMGKKYRASRLDVLIAELMRKAEQGATIQRHNAQRTLQAASEWVHRYRKVGDPFAGAVNLLAHYWAQRDWQALHDTLPLDSPLRPAVQQLTARA